MSDSDKIKKLQEENERLLKLSSVKSDIVSISAHQIRTSLSGLKWPMIILAVRLESFPRASLNTPFFP